jgi:hypothetical protein
MNLHTHIVSHKHTHTHTHTHTLTITYISNCIIETLQAAHKAVEHINAKPELLGLLNAQGPVSLGKIVEVKTQVSG